MKRFSLLVLAVALAGVSCERHEFDGPDGTKQLHEHHGAGGHSDAAGHESEHGSENTEKEHGAH